MGNSHSIARRAAAMALAGAFALAAPVRAASLQPETVRAFDHYVQLTEAQIDSELAGARPYLRVDRLPPDRRAAAHTQLRAGKVVIERLKTLDHGKSIPVPGGIIHHWIGTVFIPGATLAQTLVFVQDYDPQQDYFRPEVVRSKILRHDGNDFVIELRFWQKKIITVVLDTEHSVHYETIDSTHAWSRSRTTRIQEVEDAGGPKEHLDPVGNDDGFLWRMNTYWRFEQKDGGTYVECQSISLTRDIPTGLGWLIGPYITTIPRESLTFPLSTTRAVLLERLAAQRSR